MSETPRYVPAQATYTETQTGERVPSWGVLDTVENTFAPFGGSEEVAKFAATRVAEEPGLPWTFVSDFELAAQRFEWTGADYAEWDGSNATGYGAVDNELGRFYPFSDDADDPDGRAFVADVEANPGKYSYSSTYTKTN